MLPSMSCSTWILSPYLPLRLPRARTVGNFVHSLPPSLQPKRVRKIRANELVEGASVLREEVALRRHIVPMIDAVAVMVTMVPTSAIPAHAAVRNSVSTIVADEHPVSANLCSGVMEALSRGNLQDSVLGSASHRLCWEAPLACIEYREEGQVATGQPFSFTLVSPAEQGR